MAGSSPKSVIISPLYMKLLGNLVRESQYPEQELLTNFVDWLNKLKDHLNYKAKMWKLPLEKAFPSWRAFVKEETRLVREHGSEVHYAMSSMRPY